MVEQFVSIHGREPRISTFSIFTGLGYSAHRFLKRIINENKSDFEGAGFLPLERQKPKKGGSGGRPDESYLLNEEQFTLLILLCKNSPETVKLKAKIAKQFTIMKTALLEIKSRQSNASWIEARENGKVSRLTETDIIKEFVEYATSQGSKSAKMYYQNLSKMENKALFIIESKFKNVREALDGQQLATINTCDQLVAKSIRDGMAEGMHYKEIYKKAKADVLDLVRLIGTSYVPKQKMIGTK